MNQTILYRGPLESCNYACGYCPFAKRKEGRAAHAIDGHALTRFVGWATGRSDDTLSIFFTPWGEALIRRRYQQALATLSHLPQVRRVAIQTNLSCRLDWLADCDLTRLALWATYHPTQVPRARFLARCAELDQRGVRYSVGVVGRRDQVAKIAALRAALPSHVYLWVNADKGVPNYYPPDLIAGLTEIDPLFPINNQRHPSRGRPCRAGDTAITVDGDGVIRRCHFIPTPLGNLYDPGGLEAALRPRPCTRSTCSCHIGYINLPHLGLDAVFGDGALERVPVAGVWPPGNP